MTKHLKFIMLANKVIKYLKRDLYIRNEKNRE